MSEDRKGDREEQAPASDKPKGKPVNVAPDAVKDPNEKTGGRPGMPSQGDETDPGAG